MRRAVLLILLGVSALAARNNVSTIDFYGYKGLDVDAVRRALPFHPGDPYTAQTKPQARDTVQRILGKPATDVEAICCDQNGDRSIFIGLPGESSKPFPYRAAPTGSVRLPQDLWDLEKQLETASRAAVSAGRAGE